MQDTRIRDLRLRGLISISLRRQCKCFGFRAPVCLTPTISSRIFLLGPSHHAYFELPALSGATHYDTPFGSIPLDRDVISALHGTGHFERLSHEVDEEEHSLEMHLPYIMKAMRGRPFTLVPMLVGSVSVDTQQKVAPVLAAHLQRPDTLFVVSSDFCHWGRRFSYTRYDRAAGEVHQSIEAMDRAGMRLIEAQDLPGWQEYLRTTQNTICGRYPISLLLHTLHAARPQLSTGVTFVRYAQSSQCRSDRDSSVSYASAVITEQPTTAAAQHAQQQHVS